MKKLLQLLIFAILTVNTWAQTIPSYVPTNGLVGWWSFTGNANDLSVNGNNGTLVGGTVLTTDRFGSLNSAYAFDGSGDYIDCGNAPSVNITGSLTISAWIYASDLSTARGIVSKSALPPIDDAYQLVAGAYVPSDLNFLNSDYGYLVPTLSWVYVASVFDAASQTISLYTNGLLDTTISVAFSSIGTSSDNLCLGTHRPTFTTNWSWSGNLDDIGIWNRALTQQEISDLYQPAVTTPSSFCFTNANYYNVNTNPIGIASGDFNNDGNKDLAVTNNLSNNVSILLGDITGSFSTATNYTLTNSPAEIITADFNGDLNLDLAIAGGANNVWVLLGNGNGTFNAATNFSASLYPGSLCAADFNGDNDLDLAVANGNSANSISVLLGNGIGGFGAATNFPVGTCPCGLSCVKAGDFNGDTKIDLAIANQNSNDVSILIGDGLGAFGSPNNFAVGSFPWAVVLTDFNGDTFLDVATSNQNSDNVSILLGNGTGNFGAASNFSVGLKPEMLVYADFDGDTKMDIATSDRNSNTISVLAGDGLGAFASPTTFASTTGPFALCVNDFNNDSKMDIATTNFSSNNISVLLNCNSVGASKFEAENNFIIYPNPISDYVYVKNLSKNSTQNYTVVDFFGRTLLNGQLTTEKPKIDLRTLSSGIYFLRVNETSLKIIKE